MEATNNDGKFIIALSRALRSAHQKSLALLRQYRLTQPQFEVLEALYHKGALTIGALIQAVLSTSGNMTVVVRNLEKNGLVQCEKNPSDLRSVIVSLTPAGQELIADVFRQHMALIRESLAPITEEEKQTIIQILKKL